MDLNNSRYFTKFVKCVGVDPFLHSCRGVCSKMRIDARFLLINEVQSNVVFIE